MTIQMRRVLCPVDFSEVGKYEIALATEICRVFGAKLVLHHNLPATTPGLSKGWEWQGEHRETRGSMADAESRLGELMKTVDPSVSIEGKLTSGPLIHALLALAEQLPADLIVLGSHGRSAEDHASLCDRLMNAAACPLLCFQEGGDPSAAFHLRPESDERGALVLVATDLSKEGTAALEYAFDLARVLPVRLSLLQVVSGGEAAAAKACEKLSQSVPADLRERVECHARIGRAVDEIAKCAESLGPTFLVMGEHTRGFARTWLTRHTDREVLHRIHVPIWFVPAP